MHAVRISPARSRADIADVVALFRAYAASLPVDLAYQNFEDEVAALPGKYAQPGGELLLARLDDDTSAGCVALRPMDGNAIACEMKRLYVAPAGRGTGLGIRLVEAIMGSARAAGYAEIWLDTLPSMTEAQALYRKLGFEVSQPYYATPVAGTVFMRRVLT